MPGKAGLGMDLPKDAFLQWVGWVMSPRYLFDDARLEALQNFPNYQGALRALCMSDDPWATRPAVELLCSGFTSIKPEIVTARASRHAVARRGGMDRGGGIGRHDCRVSLSAAPSLRGAKRRSNP
jgi:predicted alpha/beta hydrolase